MCVSCHLYFLDRKHSEPLCVIFFEGSMFSRDWTFSMPKAITGLPGSCVVIPCSFDFKTSQPKNTGDEPLTRLRSLWITRKGEYVFHTGQSNVLDNFKGRTQLLGNPDEQNCTLEIDNVQPHDNGPFCFRAERGNDKYRFNHTMTLHLEKFIMLFIF
uniref:Immunoglobulin domain-containing protein n=1 Tax=Electrophorus electricus TaxID=8005 RepID=A0A4W4GG31_ELEEL